jgi:hypothetical protein
MERHEGKIVKQVAFLTVVSLCALLLFVPGVTLYYESGNGARCTSCHEMQPVYDRWHASSHRGISCDKCHGGAFTPDASFHLNNASRAVAHVKGELPEQIGFGHDYVQSMAAQCKSCHRQEYASWAAGPHSASYSRIFLDKAHNSKNMPVDDCLRCHGMHFDGGISDLVTPVSRTGPWRLVAAELADLPSMPCLTCHQVHRKGAQLTKAGEDGRVPGPSQEIARPSLALYDRRTQQYVPVAELPLPQLMDGARAVKMSTDRRQALCYQCHAPTAAMQAGSGDDRTGVGVHEGISCLACHGQHGQSTRASCASCHPKMSNCGLDVEKMDTTFLSKDSRHNVHWVKCVDCHPAGVPRMEERGR